MTVYRDRALQAAKSAKAMRRDGDYSDACNRGYYAIVYAATGLLEQAGEEQPGKTHSSLVRKFSERFVLSGTASREVGRAISLAQNLRSKADYSASGATSEDADEAIEAMDEFLNFALPLLEAETGLTRVFAGLEGSQG
jgi:uncharacterized protein (UPF0332 family)